MTDDPTPTSPIARRKKNKNYRATRSYYELLTAAKRPLDPLKLSHQQLLEMIGFHQELARDIMEFCKGDLFLLDEQVDIEDLHTQIEGLGKSNTAKLVALFALCGKFHIWQLQKMEQTQENVVQDEQSNGVASEHNDVTMQKVHVGG